MWTPSPGFAGDSNASKIVMLALHPERPAPLPGLRRGKSDRAVDLPRLRLPALAGQPVPLPKGGFTAQISVLILNIDGADWMSVTEHLPSTSRLIVLCGT